MPRKFVDEEVAESAILSCAETMVMIAGHDKIDHAKLPQNRRKKPPQISSRFKQINMITYGLYRGRVEHFLIFEKFVFGIISKILRILVKNMKTPKLFLTTLYFIGIRNTVEVIPKTSFPKIEKCSTIYRGDYACRMGSKTKVDEPVGITPERATQILELSKPKLSDDELEIAYKQWIKSKTFPKEETLVFQVWGFGIFVEIFKFLIKTLKNTQKFNNFKIFFQYF